MRCWPFGQDNGGVYFVPAFSGLFAPYWKSDARGVSSASRVTRIKVIWHARSLKHSLQTREVLEAMEFDSGKKLESLRTDGGMVEENSDAIPSGHSLNWRRVADANVRPRNPVIGVRSFSADPTIAAGR